MLLRNELEQRFRDAVGAEGPARALRLPPSLRESLVAAAQLAGGRCPDKLSEYYTEAMPRALLEQLYRREGLVSDLLWRPIDVDQAPRLRQALAGLFAELERCALPAAALLGASTPAELVAESPSAAELYAPTLFASGLPMLGAWPGERKLLARELAEGADPDALVDLRLSGNLLHELCHGLAREAMAAPCWPVTESAAITLGAAAFPRHVFPDQRAEAVPGVSLFVLFGWALARLFGERALYSILTHPRPLAQALAPRAAALEVAGWQEWLRRREPPFARDALSALSWAKLAALCVPEAPPLAAIEDAAAADQLEAAPRLPDLLKLADQTSWAETPWWQAPPAERDLAMVGPALRALFQLNVFVETFQTWPDEVPGGSLRLEVSDCTLRASKRAAGAFAEPARWLFPPPLARKLAERGCARVEVSGARRDGVSELASALCELAQGSGPLPAVVQLAQPARFRP